MKTSTMYLTVLLLLTIDSSGQSNVGRAVISPSQLQPWDPVISQPFFQSQVIQSNFGSQITQSGFQILAGVPVVSSSVFQLGFTAGLNKVNHEKDLIEQSSISTGVYYQASKKELDFQLVISGKIDRIRSNYTKITTGSQWDTQLGYNPNADTGESGAYLPELGFSPQIAASMFHNSKNIALEYNFSGNHFLTASKIWKRDKLNLITSLDFVYHNSINTGGRFTLLRVGKFNTHDIALWSTLGTDQYLNKSIEFGFGHTLFNMVYGIRQSRNFLPLSHQLGLLVKLPSPKNKSTKMASLVESNERSSLPTEEKEEYSPTESLKPEATDRITERKFSLLLNFGLNEWKLDKSDRIQLKTVIQEMLNNPELQLVVIGHSDYQGTKEIRQKISNQRAYSVAQYLIEKGISPDRISAHGISDSQPLTKQTDELSNKLNRRIDLIYYQ